MIEIERLTKQFGDLRAVDGVSLTVPTGEFFVILGPNAAGKTTTIKVMAGLMKPTSGSVRICGFDGDTHPLEARRRLAYVPDFPFLYEKLTPAEFFRFTGKLFGMEDGAMEAEAGRLAKRFHLGEFLGKPIESLSHGTKQRVAIVSALMHSPEVVVLDEPMVGLDPQHARVLKDILREQADLGQHSGMGLASSHVEGGEPMVKGDRLTKPLHQLRRTFGKTSTPSQLFVIGHGETDFSNGPLIRNLIQCRK